MTNTSFLDKITQVLIEDYSEKLFDTIVILPNKRAKVFLLDSLKKQNCHAFVVFDRIIPTVETNSDITVLQNTTGTGFLAGKCRDIGLAEAIKKYDKYIFIDDDCIPQQKLVESHNKILSINTFYII